MKQMPDSERADKTVKLPGYGRDTGRDHYKGRGGLQRRNAHAYSAAATVQSVEARTYFDNPELFAKDSYVSGHTTGPEVNRTRVL